MMRIQRGFTLIEMLVVLIMVAMISSVLFQALERSYSLQRRFGTELFKVQQGQMATDWYRQTVQGLYPDQLGASNTFHGDASSFSGLTTNPLGDDHGAPTPFQWTLVIHPDRNNTELTYRDSGPPTTLLTWRGTDAKFVYLDEQQVTHDRWPPPLGLFPQLPRQIHVEAKDDGERISIFASPRGPTDPEPRPQDVFGVNP
nr:type II secretion system protein [Rhodoferax sp.]